jgi:anti-sigma B factor antagonist
MSFSVAFRRAADGPPTDDPPVEGAPALPPGLCVVAPSGELDAHTAPEFEAALLHALAQGDARLVVDGAGLDYVSSAGLGVFMACLEPAREAGGDLKVAALSPRVFEVFSLLGFPEVLDMAPTVAEAVARFSTPADEG